MKSEDKRIAVCVGLLLARLFYEVPTVGMLISPFYS